MKRNFFKTVIVVLMIALAVFAVSCSQDAGSSGLNGSGKATGDAPSWLCMFYLDLSDLPGLSNLNEICAAVNASPDTFNSGNCDMYIMTGGAQSGNAVFSEDDGFDALYAAVDNNYNAFATSQSANKYQYWKLVVNKNKAYLSPVTFSTKAMSDSNVLYDFMNKCYSLKDYSASKIILNLWDHGGGSFQGLVWDYSISTQPGMSLSGLKSALAKFKAKNNKEIECINFDMCLMSSAEVVYTVKDYVNYMVASEPTAAGRGSSYKDWVTWLYNDANKGSDGKEFAKMFCQTAIEACSNNTNTDDQDPGAVWTAFNLTKDQNGTCSTWETFNTTYKSFLSALQGKGSSAITTALTTMKKKTAAGCELSQSVGKGSELYTNAMYDIYQVRRFLSLDTAIDTALTPGDGKLIIGCYMAAGSGKITTDGGRNNETVDEKIAISGARNKGDSSNKTARGLSMCILTTDDTTTEDPAYATYVKNCVTPETKALYELLLN